MHTEFSYDDYLFLEIQKHLLELEELTTDVTYRKIVYKTILQNVSNEDIITSVKEKYKKEIHSDNLEYFDYSENKSNLVLQQILETIKYIKSNIKDNIIDKPEKFFTDIFNKIVIEDQQKQNLYHLKNTKLNITDKQVNSIYVTNCIKNTIEDLSKASTRIKKV